MELRFGFISGKEKTQKEVACLLYTSVMPDRIEAGTFLCMAAATSGKIKLINEIGRAHV